MGASTLVDTQVDDGRKLIKRLTQDGFPLTAVFWVETSVDEALDEEGDWFLYIASPVVDQQGSATAYRAVLAALRTIPSTWINVSNLKLIGVNDSITQDVLGIQAHYPGKDPAFSRRRRLGSISIDELYMYALGADPEQLTSLGQPIPEALTDPGNGGGPLEYIEIPYLKSPADGGGNAMPIPSVLRLKRKEVSTFEVLTGLQVIEGRHFSTYAKVSMVDDGVIGVDYRVEEIK